jgi:16S rRNA (guanine527-N7)-methyltransferase
MRENLINIFLEKNNQLNLSAIRDPEWVRIKHILDSIELNKFFELWKWKTVCDIGTGWWFPLLPLAMTNPNVSFTGIDARRKKVDSVNEMIDKLWIKNAKCVRTRIEDFNKQCDYITARAVWYVDKIIPRSYDLLKKWWYFIFYKQYDEAEFKVLNELCKKYKLKIVNTHRYSLFDWDIDRVIYVIEKM